MILNEIIQAIHPLQVIGVSDDLQNLDIRHLLTDSRLLGSEPEATLFFALKTEKNDGAKYIPTLIDKGVRCFVLTEEQHYTILHHTTPHYTTLHHTSHGYCVLWGMVAEVYLSVVHAGCPREVLQQLTQIMLQWYGRPQCDCKQREELIARMYQDKKNRANCLPNFTLLQDVGKPLINQCVKESDIDEALEYLFSI